MHTVFINTTQNRLGVNIDVLKHEMELKRMMYLDCPIGSWTDSKNGFKKAVQSISDFIDSYSGVDNKYNLMVFVDVAELIGSMQIPFSTMDVSEQTAVCSFCVDIATRFIASTVLNELETVDRVPAENTLLLLELPKLKKVDYDIDLYKHKPAAIAKLLRLLPDAEIIAKTSESRDNGNRVSVKDVVTDAPDGIIADPCELYGNYIESMLEELKKGAGFNRAYEGLVSLINTASNDDRNHLISVSEYASNKAVRNSSLEVRLKYDFLLQSFILDCITSKTTHYKAGDRLVPKTVPVMSDEQWERVLKVLSDKKKCYEDNEREASRLDVAYTEMGLAPPIYVPAREKFGLDESGDISHKYAIREVVENTPKSIAQLAAGDKDGMLDKSVELAEEIGVVQNWFKEEEYKLYDSDGDEYVGEDNKLLSPDEYCEKAAELANHHLNIINKLNLHIKRGMSKYSCRSMMNEPPILRKRAVNTGEKAALSIQNDYKYALKSGADFVIETEPSESVIESSKRSYITLMNEYLRFISERTVKLTSIKEQCEWFINRVQQIKKSLSRLMALFVVLAVFIGVVYIPFVVIQWEAIFKNITTVVGAVCSLAIPFVLLCICYKAAEIFHRRKMKAAWEKLVERSRQASKENKEVISAYDSLMTKYIPALRWIYEYVLDIDFHRDCCKVARVKLNHHRQKLNERRDIIERFLADLDYIDDGAETVKRDCRVEYTKAFCEGENQEFYSVIDKEVLGIIFEEREAS